MSATNPTTESHPALLPRLSKGLGALAGAVDDLHRAALVLRQESRTPTERFRSPDDLRRIAGQLSDRASSCKAAHEAILAICQQLDGDRS